MAHWNFFSCLMNADDNFCLSLSPEFHNREYSEAIEKYVEHAS